MTYKNGDEAYLETGQIVEYVAYVGGEGHVVRPIYEPKDREPYWGKPITVREVFKEPPLVKYDEAINEAQKRLDAINAEVAQLRAERDEFQKNEYERRERLKAHERFEELDNFLAGKITHAVVLDHQVIPYYVSFDEEFVRDRDRWGSTHKIRGIELEGNLYQKKLVWTLKQTYDTGTRYFIPCTSEDEAKAHITRLFNEAMEKIRSSGQMNTFNYWVEWATKNERELPADLLERYYEGMWENAVKAHKDAEEKLGAAIARLDELKEKLGK